MKSWKTTFCGVAAIVVMVLNACIATFDGNAATVADWSGVIAAVIAGIGLIIARDNDKSSEDVGAK